MTTKPFTDFIMRTFDSAGNQIDTYTGTFTPFSLLNSVPPNSFNVAFLSTNILDRANGAITTY